MAEPRALYPLGVHMRDGETLTTVELVPRCVYCDHQPADHRRDRQACAPCLGLGSPEPCRRPPELVQAKADQAREVFNALRQLGDIQRRVIDGEPGS